MDQQKLFRKALEKWGEVSQILVAIEEMSELQKELCKLDRCHDIRSKETQIRKIADEIADVSIMLDQLKFIFACHNLTKEKRNFKLARLRQMLNA